MKKFIRSLVSLSLAILVFGLSSGCASQSANTETTTTVATEVTSPSAESTTAPEDTTSADTTTPGTSTAEEIYYTGDPVTLKVLADITPHAELFALITPILEKQGITIEIVSTAADSTWNEKTNNGEVDINYFQHLPYLESENEANGYDLVSVGSIHVEPISAYSNVHATLNDVPDDAKIVIPNDPTNEYRALKILETAGFIKLDPSVEDSLQADVTDIIEYVKPVTITELDAIQIIGLAAEFDVYITNTNKALEAGVDTTKYLFREDTNSPYGNIIVTTADRANDPAILAVVKALQSESTKAYIEANYKGAVLPATDSK